MKKSKAFGRAVKTAFIMLSAFATVLGSVQIPFLSDIVKVKTATNFSDMSDHCSLDRKSVV